MIEENFFFRKKSGISQEQHHIYLIKLIYKYFIKKQNRINRLYHLLKIFPLFFIFFKNGLKRAPILNSAQMLFNLYLPTKFHF